MISLWFGNFFEPFYSDRESTRRGIEEVAALGFTTMNLDSKPWEDFFARYRSEAASQYVSMHEFMMKEAAAARSSTDRDANWRGVRWGSRRTRSNSIASGGTRK